MAVQTIQICGTGSGVGKSVIAAGLCRILLQDGYRVAPFKAQNMSLNSFVTDEGGEIGRAQAMQAMACRLKPSVDMNPILLKPNSDTGSQVILRGQPVRNMSAVIYKDYKKKAKRAVLDSFHRLSKDRNAIVIEGAGSPAEVNLKSHDIVNMKMAQAVGAPVILVGDIDKGGVFAWLTGTLDLLTKEERRMVKGFIINKFRGDKRLLKSGIGFLEKRTGVKVVGVIPYFKDIKIPEEDSASLECETRHGRSSPPKRRLVDMAVIKLPHISNFTDFDPLRDEPDVKMRYVGSKDEIGSADVVIIPGTKSTIADLIWLKKKGLAEFLRTTNDEPRPRSKGRGRRRTTIIGICGGYQMLGREIRDSHGMESKQRRIKGIGLLPVKTIFKKDKILAQVKAIDIRSRQKVSGYEIHHGRTERLKGSKPAFRIIERHGKSASSLDGAVSKDGNIWGTYIHGVFDDDTFRRRFLNRLRAKKGWGPITDVRKVNPDRELDSLARLIRKNIDLKALYRILNDGL